MLAHACKRVGKVTRGISIWISRLLARFPPFFCGGILMPGFITRRKFADWLHIHLQQTEKQHLHTQFSINWIHSAIWQNRCKQAAEIARKPFKKPKMFPCLMMVLSRQCSRITPPPVLFSSLAASISRRYLFSFSSPPFFFSSASLGQSAREETTFHSLHELATASNYLIKIPLNSSKGGRVGRQRGRRGKLNQLQKLLSLRANKHPVVQSTAGLKS